MQESRCALLHEIAIRTLVNNEMRILSWIATALFISAGIDLIKLIVVLRKYHKSERKNENQD